MQTLKALLVRRCERMAMTAIASSGQRLLASRELSLLGALIAPRQYLGGRIAVVQVAQLDGR